MSKSAKQKLAERSNLINKTSLNSLMQMINKTNEALRLKQITFEQLYPHKVAENIINISKLMEKIPFHDLCDFTYINGLAISQYHVHFINILCQASLNSPEMLENDQILQCITDNNFINTLQGAKKDQYEILREVIRCFGRYEKSHHGMLNEEVVKTAKKLEPILRADKDVWQGKPKAIVQIYSCLGSFILAKEYIQNIKNTNSQNILKVTAIESLVSTISDIDEIYIRHVLNALEVDIPSFSYNLVGIYGATACIMDSICILFKEGRQDHAKKLLDCFIHIGLDLNGNSSYTNALILVMNEVEDLSPENKFELITHLVEKCGADLNAEIKAEGAKDYITTPVSNAMGLGNLKLLKYVLENGGKPLIKSGVIICIEDSRVELNAIQKSESFRLVEKYMIEQIEKEMASASIENVVEEGKIVDEITPDENVETKNEEKSESIAVFPVDECIENYVALEKWKSKYSNILDEESLKSAIDILVLNWIKDEENREKYIDQIDELLDAHPELHGYSVTAALQQNISLSNAGEIFGNRQKLFHEFCVIKKGLVNAEHDPNEKAIDNVLGENIYKINTSENFKNLCFFKLPENHGLEESKLSDKGFIARKSIGENGIKLHKNGCTKLKVDGCDKAYYSKECLVDKDFGNLMYIFGCFSNHEEGDNIINSHQPIEKHYIPHEDFCSILSGQTEFHCEELSNF